MSSPVPASEPTIDCAVVGKKVLVRLPWWKRIKPAFSFRTEEYTGYLDVPAEIIKVGPDPYFATVRVLENGLLNGQDIIYHAGDVFPVRRSEMLNA